MLLLRAILVNAYTRTITEVMIEEGTHPIYKELSKDAAPVSDFTCVDLSVNADGITQTAYVDGEGMFTQTEFIYFKGAPHPLAGSALILGTDMENGESASASLTIDEVRDMVQFMSQIEVLAGCVVGDW